MKKGQPITARRVDEMGVRLPLEESPCPHRSSSSAFSTGVSSSTPGSPLSPPISTIPVAPHSISTSNVVYLRPPLAVSFSSDWSRWLPVSRSLSLSLPPGSPVSIAKKFTFVKKRVREKSMPAADWLRGRRIAAALVLPSRRAWLKDELSLCHRLY